MPLSVIEWIDVRERGSPALERCPDGRKCLYRGLSRTSFDT